MSFGGLRFPHYSCICLKGKAGIFKPGPYVYIFGCVNDTSKSLGHAYNSCNLILRSNDNHMLTWSRVILSSMFNLTQHVHDVIDSLLCEWAWVSFDLTPLIWKTREVTWLYINICHSNLFSQWVPCWFIYFSGHSLTRVYVLYTRLRMVCLSGLLVVVMASVCVPSFGSVCWDNSICKDLSNMGRILVGH